ncbi:MAG: UDP-N-acetylmuramate dehydrogenase, partial [Helicobacter sp.]|nr:UDP-N-acetylmuramate dehydrogenase [Helicobacter sp.]
PKEPSFGRCFKNPPNHYAGTLIQNVQLKGVRFGKNKNLCFSPKHANFMINLGDSSFDEAVELLELAKKRVYENYGITLQEEVCIIR